MLGKVRGGKQRNDAPLHSAGEVGGKGRGRGARGQVTHASFGVGGRGNTRLNAVPTHYHTLH